ncbi:MAG: helix-turn-helix domain-containing protein [Bacillota bacterium]|jgi:transposase InsO family protein
MRNRKQLEAAGDVKELSELLTNLAGAITDRRDGNFEEYKQRFRASGFEGLKDLRLPRKTRPRVTSKDNIALIIALSLEHPGWGCIRLSRALREQGIMISPPTVQSILNKNNLRDKTERALQLEERAAREKRGLSAEQIGMIEKVNPCFRERVNESRLPGELLVQDTFFVGKLKEIGKLYLQMAVDTYNNYAFCLLHIGKFSDYAVALLYHQVLPFYRKQGLAVSSILTDNGREYCGKEKHHFELYLRLNEIEHRCLPKRQEQTNGYIQRFRHTVLHEFFMPNLTENKFGNLESMQTVLADWLNEYNTQKPLRGYRNFGKTPEAMLNEFVFKQKEEAN